MLPEKDGKNPIDCIGISSQSQRRWEEPLSRASMLSLNVSLLFVRSILFASFLFLMQILLFLLQPNGVRT